MLKLNATAKVKGNTHSLICGSILKVGKVPYNVLSENNVSFTKAQQSLLQNIIIRSVSILSDDPHQAPVDTAKLPWLRRLSYGFCCIVDLVVGFSSTPCCVWFHSMIFDLKSCQSCDTSLLWHNVVKLLFFCFRFSFSDHLRINIIWFTGSAAEVCVSGCGCDTAPVVTFSYRLCCVWLHSAIFNLLVFFQIWVEYEYLVLWSLSKADLQSLVDGFADFCSW